MKNSSKLNQKNKIKIIPMTLDDIDELELWQKKYGDTIFFDTIREFILEGDTIRDFRELIDTNYTFVPIGSRERKFSFVAKNEKEEIVAWFLCMVFKDKRKEGLDEIAQLFDDDYDDESTSSVDFYTRDNEDTIYSMFMQYLVVHPMQQGRGLGPQIAREMIFNSQNYVGVQPDEFFGYIHKDNHQSQKVFRNFGFNFVPKNDPNYIQTIATLPELEKKAGINRTKPQEFGE